MASLSHASAARELPTPDGADQERDRFFVQAPIPPVAEDGRVALALGTAVFAVLAVLARVMHERLDAAGVGWWFWVAVSGVAIGLIGFVYAVIRQNKIKRSRAARSSSTAQSNRAA